MRQPARGPGGTAGQPASTAATRAVTAGAAGGVLYLHPYNHTVPHVIAAGSIAAVNLVPGPRLGRYAEEVTRDEIEAAAVLLLDVHWFLPIAVVGGVIASLRRINPGARIVVGGITASFFRRLFLERFPADYLVSGHAERSLPTLVAHLLRGERPPPLPDVWNGTGAPVEDLAPPPDLDDLDWLTIDWFPSYRAEVERRHAGHSFDPRCPQMDCHPVLLLSRGCHRHCGFCFGSYQRHVLGAGVSLRSPAALVADLRRVVADPALRFVSLFVGDASHLDGYARALRGLRLELDAYVYFCGTTPGRTLDQINSGFAGRVGYSIVQEEDLRHFRGEPDRATREQAFARMLRHIERLAGSGAVVYFVGKASPATLAVRDRPNLLLASGEDWNVKRPDVAALRAGVTLDRHFDDVIAASHVAAGTRLLRTLVPAIRDAFRTDEPLVLEPGAVDSRRLDPLAATIARLYTEAVCHVGYYGIGDVTLRWGGTAATAGFGAGWRAPGKPLPGRCRWDAGLTGLNWNGEATVAGDAPLAIAPVPTVHPPGLAPIELWRWSPARVPAVEVAPGPRRRIRLGGSAAADGLRLWVRDRGRTVEHHLEHGRPVAALAGQEHLATLRRGLGLGAPWPASNWPTLILASLRQPAAAPPAGWELEYTEAAGTHVDLVFAGPGGEVLPVVVFPRPVQTHVPTTEKLAFAYGGPDSSDAMRLLLGWLDRTLRAAERPLGAARQSPPR
ncbi:MAG: hypothetical protein HY906_10885 [Deltaproteobacteria bacterium]|nr:hypothetical protein [Deltaproteobacteria bacterium]